MACETVLVVTKLATPSKVARGCIAFAVWWVFAVFPAVPFLPIGRTAGSLLGATLMVVFEDISPDQAFAAIDLPILALLFGTMVVSEYLKRADLFKYLGYALSHKSKGAMDLLCRVCVLAAVSSALFTNDTTCVVLTPFVLEICRNENLHPKPFLLALACSSNIGSAATAIGNPQNLVIAVSSGISFGTFLAGVVPAVAIGLVANTLLLVVVYGRSLSGYDWCTYPIVNGVSTPVTHPEILEDLGNGHIKVTIVWDPSTENSDMPDHGEARRESLSPRNCTEIVVSSGAPSSNADADAASPSPDASSAPGVGIVGDNIEGSTRIPGGRTVSQKMVKVTEEEDSEISSSPGNSFRSFSGGDLDAKYANFRGSVSVRKRNTGYGDVELQNHAVPFDIEAKGDHEHKDDTSVLKKRGISKAFSKRADMFRRRVIWKFCVYLVTLGMLAALLAGLSLPWTALTAAVVMMVLDFSDAGPSLDKVNYALLVFFCGMFIATSGFNQTGVPAVFWSAVEPHSQIGTASGVIVLSVVVTVLSNVVSNVPTVILLGSKVAASAVASGASSDKAWLILAWVSTVAGNLTLLGSAANIIVAEQARETSIEKENRKKHSNDHTRATYDLTFWKHLKFGFPSTLIVIAVGLVPIALRNF
ncbi:hypothetical protein M758_1G315700 [Ceratodon purpureus]|nr:hypothetical protein M758_1G315700 [Ceratodon purpureus]KAG0632263.1 hypothetical protein M758_1G315700 [Ceratodon purpureus]KAG0632264.1 hypothetical protein M758_1G315700 [Ceratodon purpureus]KAG0632265.1 hypothetical protein M758_1G315700 [Ceratodon purpureus]